eukprot:3967837-Amphidinium_carterae.1
MGWRMVIAVRLSVDELRKVHAASRKHGMPGHTCKPCHFASGQCWQGNECVALSSSLMPRREDC